MCRQNLRYQICARNPRTFYEWNQLIFWNMFKDYLWIPVTYRHQIVRLSANEIERNIKRSQS